MKFCVVTGILLGVLLVVSGDDLDLDLPPVETSLPQIPGLEKFINVSAADLATIEEGDRIFQEKCIKNGGENAYDRVVETRTDTLNCLQTKVNVTELQAEMEKAKPTGDLDTVFRKYCGRKSELTACIMNFVSTMEDCMDEEEKGMQALAQNMTDQLLNFICFKEGDRIALFIAESGPECLSDKKEAIIHCINTTYGKHIPSGNIGLNALPTFLIGAEECKDVCALQHCVVRELEKCKEPTPANIVESMFKYVLKVTPCTRCEPDKLKAAHSTAASVSSTLIPVFLFSAAVSFLTL